MVIFNCVKDNALKQICFYTNNKQASPTQILNVMYK